MEMICPHDWLPVKDPRTMREKERRSGAEWVKCNEALFFADDAVIPFQRFFSQCFPLLEKAGFRMLIIILWVDERCEYLKHRSCGERYSIDPL